MFYSLTDIEMTRFIHALQSAISIQFIDDIEDFILEAIWCHAKNVPIVDPFYNTRSKKLYDVVDNQSHIGWSVKSIQHNFHPGREFELVIQRADVYKKCVELGFPGLSSESDPNDIGAALLRHWNTKISGDSIAQNVTDKRVMILLKNTNRKSYAIYEEDIHEYRPEDLEWQWTSQAHNGLKGFRKSDGMCVYRWYPSQKQLFERFKLPTDAQTFSIEPKRLSIETVVHALSPFLREHQ